MKEMAEMPYPRLWELDNECWMYPAHERMLPDYKNEKGYYGIYGLFVDWRRDYNSLWLTSMRS